MPAHAVVLPAMEAGCTGAMEVMVTAAVLTTLLPQLLFALTDREPPVDPAVSVIALVVDVPVHPDGKVHV